MKVRSRLNLIILKLIKQKNKIRVLKQYLKNC